MNPDLHHLYAIDRQLRLQAEARAHARIRIARRRAGERPDAATRTPSAIGKALPHRS